MSVTQTVSAKYALPIFTFTLFFSAFLLFSVQPFFAKMVLPRLGGSPAVWSVAMVFFQSALLAGYAYAHLLAKKFSTRHAAIIHLIVMAIAFIFLPMTIASSFQAPPESGQTLWLFALFTASIGLPFFAVSANGPLLQAWFSRTGHPHADDPYFLYGASNIGSFASLFLYIILFEPFFALGTQSLQWTIGFICLGALIAICALITVQRHLTHQTQQSAASSTTDIKSSSINQTPTSWRTRIKWIIYSAIPSGLLVASTAHISTDIASIPFLWVAPLALFLLTFVFAFARKPLASISALSALVILLTVAFLFIVFVGANLPIYIQVAFHLTYFFIAALLCHSLLVAERPVASDLTSFYLWMSVGGVLGGMFTSLISPLLFNWVAEYALLAVAAYLICPNIWNRNPKETTILIIVSSLIAFLINTPLAWGFADTVSPAYIILAFIALSLLAIIMHFRKEPLAAFCIIVICGIFFFSKHGINNLYVDRSFFGVVSAKHSSDGTRINMLHGAIVHGAVKANSTGKPQPLTYYHRSGPIAETLFAVQNRDLARRVNVGIVGLGIGSMLCHRQANEHWTLFEIDTAVIELAKRADIFPFMSECSAPTDEMVVGDARLSIVDQDNHKFDYLLIDAFSSDSIPVHLMTVQAMKLFKQKVALDGLLVFHISNRHMELESVLAANANALGLNAKIYNYEANEENKKDGATDSVVVSLSLSENNFGDLNQKDHWTPLDAKTTTPWTDDYSNVLAAILRKH